MAEIVINNSYYKNKLDNLIDEFYSLDYDNMDYTKISGNLDNGEYYCSREYLNDVMSREHVGYPDAYYSSSISNAVEKIQTNGNGFTNITNMNFHQRLVRSIMLY